MVPEIREIEPGEEHLLPLIDHHAEGLFQPFGYWPLPGLEDIAAPPPVVTLVAGRPPVGFAEISEVDGHAHLAQLAVLPEHGRKGIGRALVHAACEWAGAAGHEVITLTTFADIPFNAPWYERLGFAELRDRPGPQLAAVIEEERPLEALGRRVTMGRRI